MQVVYTNCAGLDVHKRSVVGCILNSDPNQPTAAPKKQLKTFGTMVEDILALGDWLMSNGCTQVVMESTASYWKPVYNLLETQFELIVVNAHHIKAVPGRKTDVKDAEWLAQLLRHGLLRASFIPNAPQRELRELTRYRTSLVQERARMVNRLQKVLEDSNVRLASVVSDIMGVSARAMLDKMLEGGEHDVEALADLARGRLREKRAELIQALKPQFKPHHRFMVAEQLSHIDHLEEAIERLNEEIKVRLDPFEQTVTRLDEIRG